MIKARHLASKPFDLEAFVGSFAAAVGRDDITSESLRARLDANLERAVLEGLFAEACVVVEGQEDEALISGACAAAGVRLDEAGIAVIQTRGKTSMPLVVGFLLQAGIPTYPVFDLDRNLDPDKQHRWAELAIQRLLSEDGVAEEITEGEVRPDLACWTHNLGATVDGECGPGYVEIRNAVANDLGFTRDQGKKSAPVLRDTLRRAKAEGLGSASLDALVDRIQQL